MMERSPAGAPLLYVTCCAKSYKLLTCVCPAAMCCSICPGDNGAFTLQALREVGACHQQLNNHTAALQAYSEALNRTTSDVSTGA
jgi:hypothetical protein